MTPPTPTQPRRVTIMDAALAADRTARHLSRALHPSSGVTDPAVRADLRAAATQNRRVTDALTKIRAALTSRTR